MKINHAELNFIKKNIKKLPTIVLANEVIIPPCNTPIFFNINESKQIMETIQEAQNNYHGFFLITTQEKLSQPFNINNIIKTGSIGKILELRKQDNINYYLNFKSVVKFNVDSYSENNSKVIFADGNPEIDTYQAIKNDQINSLHKELFNLLSEFLSKVNDERVDYTRYLTTHEEIHPNYLVGFCNLVLKPNLTFIDRINIIETKDIMENQVFFLKKIESILNNQENNSSQIDQEIDGKTFQNIQKENKLNFLKKRRETIESEILQLEGNASQSFNPNLSPHQKFEALLAKTKMTKEAKELAKREIQRIKNMHPSSSEFHIIENYLNTLFGYPWQKMTKDSLDIKKAKKILDEDHFGIEDVKTPILQYLAITKLKNKPSGNILCLAGPPGVGKTSICKSIARAMGRKYARIGLGGVSDEAEIRGHRKTYVGAMPGKLVSTLLKLKVNNPVIVLDEIDKLTARSHKGSVEAALLEVLDPEQNVSFNDHFLNLGIDLSKVLFIATANDISQISGPLRDRMDIINLSSYTSNEKFEIAKRYLVPKEIEENGLKKFDISFKDKSLKLVIDQYTRESGVRGLRKRISQVLRSCATELLEDKNKKIEITPDKINKIFKNKYILKENIKESLNPGTALGLAWTPFGGELLYVESTSYKGTGLINTTGQLGEVMKESSHIASTLIKKLNPDKIENLEKMNIHIHFPAGAIPKDGPSAGVTLVSALHSLINDFSINPKLAMTGEISLNGDVLPVGGIKEKLIAAYMQGANKVLIPYQNEKDIQELPEEILNDKKFMITPVKRIDEVIDNLN